MRAHCLRGYETAGVVDCRDIAERDNRTDTGRGHQPSNTLVIADQGSQVPLNLVSFAQQRVPGISPYPAASTSRGPSDAGIAVVHRSSLSVRDLGQPGPEKNYGANSRISRPCAWPAIGRGLRGTHGVPIACFAISSKLYRPILTAPRLLGISSPAMNRSSTSPGWPIAAATSAPCRSCSRR
jgi:hypothetical protein